MGENLKTKTFLVVDDHVMIRLSLEIVIQTLFLDANVLQANTLEIASGFLGKHKIDYIIVDINFPDGNSLKFVMDSVKEYPGVKIMVYTAYDDVLHALNYLRAGACGFMSKQQGESAIRDAINQLVLKGKYVPSTLMNLILDSYLLNRSIVPIEILSARELEIAKLLVKGYGNIEIANKLSIKQNTVSTIKGRIFNKLKINNLPNLIDIFKEYESLIN